MSWTHSALLGALLVGGTASAQDEYRALDHLVIILDGSGSMDEKMRGGTRMTAAKKALRIALAELPASTRIGLLTFSANVRDPWLFPLGPRDDERLNQAIDQPKPGGRTPLGHYLKIGSDRLFEAREAEHGYGTYRLLVVTDGEATDEELMVSFAPMLVGRGVGLDVIGVAMPGDHELKRYAHSYRSADDPKTLQRAVQEALAEVTFSGDEATAGAAFAFLDGLPDDFAMAALAELSAVGQLNHPLGDLPPPPPPPPAPPPQPVLEPVFDDDVASCAVAVAPWWVGVLALVGIGRRRQR